MKRVSYLVLIGEIVAICLLHAIKINQSSKADQHSVEKKSVIKDNYNKIEYASFRQLASY